MNVIRKIVVGPNPKDAMAYFVVMKAGTSRVCLIEEDESALFAHNVRKFNIYIQDEDSTYIWKSVENVPVVVEYDCNFE